MPKQDPTAPVPPARARLAELQAALYGAKITDEERREHDRQVAAQAARDLDSRTIEAEFRDCLEFAKAHGMSGTPKYRREAIRSLRRAAEIVGGTL